jgi:hypothetical protein
MPKKPKLCRRCRKNPATLTDPDRYAGVGRPQKDICPECNAKRLADGLYSAAKRLAKGG